MLSIVTRGGWKIVRMVLLGISLGLATLGCAPRPRLYPYPLGEDVAASLALSDGRIYIRGSKHLWCIGK